MEAFLVSEWQSALMGTLGLKQMLSADINSAPKYGSSCDACFRVQSPLLKRGGLALSLSRPSNTRLLFEGRDRFGLCGPRQSRKEWELLKGPQ